jgi:hypothetical protein
MNSLLLGTADKTDALLDLAEPGFLLIDDGPIADAFAEQFPDAEIFNPRRHSFATARDYKSVRAFADILYSHGYGEQTLTVRNGRRTIAKLLLDNETPLHKIDGDRKDPAIAEALGMLDDLLLSPVLRRVLTRKPNFSLGTRSVIARINRAELGDFDAFVLALLLIGQAKRQVIVPDFGFYGRPLHVSLIRQNRLVCGVSYLSQFGQKDSVLRQAVLGIKDKTGQGCTYDDAAVLAGYAGILPGTNFHAEFVGHLMGDGIPPAWNPENMP